MQLDLVCYNVVEDSFIYIHNENCPVIFFSFDVFSCFGMEVKLGPLFFLAGGRFPGNFEKDWCCFLFKHLVELTAKVIQSWTFLCWKVSYYRFLLVDYSLLVIGLLRFYISSKNFVVICFFTNWSISSRCYLLIYSWSPCFFYFYMVSLEVIPLLSFVILVICIFSFLFLSIWLIICQSYHLFKEPVIMFAIFLFSVLLIFALIFVISFILLALGLACFSFSNSSRYEVRLLIWNISSFLKQTFTPIKFL